MKINVIQDMFFCYVLVVGVEALTPWIFDFVVSILILLCSVHGINVYLREGLMSMTIVLASFTGFQLSLFW
jgi:hypothetical protein